MNESYREKRPLLGEEFCDEEALWRRNVGFKGRARNKVRGAAAIITGWPDHWSSSVQLWWIIIAMLLLTALVIYNVALTLALLPTYNHIVREKDNAVEQKNQSAVIKLPEVFMHVFVDVNEEIDINKYLPPIKKITEKHTRFNYNLIFIVNDTKVESDPNGSDELNNLVVLDDIFNTRMFTYKRITKVHNIDVMQISLSNFMSCSPLNKRWHLIQPGFIPFLVRAISIWDSSGIAFNPLIIKPDYPAYIEKLHDIFKTYEKSKNEVPLMDTTVKQNLKIKKKLNNIRDIIDALETDNELNNHALENLTEAETINQDKIHGENVLSLGTNGGNEVSKQDQNGNEKNTQNRSRFENNTSKDIIPKLRTLPLFLDLIWNKKPQTDSANKHEENTPVLTRRRKSPRVNKYAVLGKQIDKIDTLKPMNMAVKVDKKQVNKEIELKDSYFPATWDKYNKLSIDLKGDIIASEVSCHSFIGTLFDNIFQKPEKENVTGFLIRELSLFCRGVLSRCKGVDVILL